MGRRKDGSVVMPPMSYEQQAHEFYGMVAGFGLGRGLDLWALLDGAMLQVQCATHGTLSHKLYRAALLDGPTFYVAMVALLDSLPTWAKSPPINILPSDADIQSEDEP